MSEIPAEDPRHAIEPGLDAVRRERDLPVPAEDAWSLLRDAEGLSRWLADDVDLVVEPGRVGSMRDGDELRSVVVDEVEPNRHVALRWWSADGDEASGTLVDLVLEPTGAERSRIVVTEVPLREVAIPDTIPASWGARVDRRTQGGGTSTAPQPRALAGCAR